MLLLSSLSFWPDNYPPLEFCLLALFVLIDLIVFFVICSLRRQIKKKKKALAKAANAPAPAVTVTNNTDNGATTPRVIVINNGAAQQEDVVKNVILDENSKIVDKDAVILDENSKIVDKDAVILDENSKIVDKDAIILDENSMVVDDDSVVFKRTETKTFDECFEELSREQQSFYNELFEYAMSKDNVKDLHSNTGVKIKVRSKLLVNFKIRKETVVALFVLENDMLKKYRKESAAEQGTKIAIKPTEIPVYDLNSFDTAKGLIDVAYEQIQNEFNEEHEARKERRRKARRDKKATDNSQGE